MKQNVLCVLVVGVLVAAGELKAGDAKSKLKGTWAIVSWVIAGEKQPEEWWKGMVLTFEGEIATWSGKGKPDKNAYKIDAAQKPAHLDLQPERRPEKKIKAIYQIEGDALKIAMTDDGRERAKNFDEKIYVVFKLKCLKK
jgi:uncharacterized protein (TIGR03067 family)